MSASHPTDQTANPLSSLFSPPIPSADREHDARVVASILRAHRDIPFYSRSSRRIPTESSSLDEALKTAPLLTKKDIRATLPKQWVPTNIDLKAALASGDIEIVETSASNEERLRILWDKDWWLRQEERAMRVHPLIARAIDSNVDVYREAILTTPALGMRTCNAADFPFEQRVEGRYLFLNMRPDPTFWRTDDMTRMLDEIERHKTVGLESDPAYLATLCRHASSVGRKLDVRRFVQLTYAMTAANHIRAIRRAYDGPLLQLYGASEVGVLFMQGEDGFLHHVPYTTHVELLPAKVRTPGAVDVALVVVTTLDRSSQPLVRFVVGDLAQVNWAGPRMFTSVAPLSSFEGRVEDALVLTDGALVTAGAIDRALAPLEEIDGYQINQSTPDRIEVDIVATGDARSSHVNDVRSQLTALIVGSDSTTPSTTMEIRTVTAVAAEPSGKFRTVRRHFPLDVAITFEGCGAASTL